MGRNLIKEYVNFTEKNLKIYTKKIMGKYYDEELFSKYLSEYINVRYYNQEQWVRKDLSNHLTHYLTKIYEKEETKTSKFILELFKKYYYIDDVLDFNYEKNLDDYVEMVNKIKIEKVGINDSNFSKEFKELVYNNEKKRIEYLSNFDSNDFYLDIKETSKENTFNVEINQKVKVPKIFSDYAINKVWNDTLVSENKLQVEYSLLNQLILKNIINGDFLSNYIVGIASNLFKKEDKLKRTLKIFDNDIGKELITLKISYDDFLENKELILEYIKEGYQFALIINDKYFKDNSNNALLDIFKYVIIKNNDTIKEKMKEQRNIIIMN